MVDMELKVNCGELHYLLSQRGTIKQTEVGKNKEVLAKEHIEFQSIKSSLNRKGHLSSVHSTPVENHFYREHAINSAEGDHKPCH